MKDLSNSRFMRMVRQNSLEKEDELHDAFGEFDHLLQDFLFSDAGYFSIDRTLNDLLFDLRFFGRKKGAQNFTIS